MAANYLFVYFWTFTCHKIEKNNPFFFISQNIFQLLNQDQDQPKMWHIYYNLQLSLS
jgi:hypothetical protein